MNRCCESVATSARRRSEVAVATRQSLFTDLHEEIEPVPVRIQRPRGLNELASAAGLAAASTSETSAMAERPMSARNCEALRAQRCHEERKMPV